MLEAAIEMSRTDSLATGIQSWLVSGVTTRYKYKSIVEACFFRNVMKPPSAKMLGFMASDTFPETPISHD